ncbi:hypothetical protein C8Q76DRAFT_793997 [Earliella scabrosa]|nr:hypothetical protein C8Q76DRAFT_793997 [Earliella scabrosa]
MKSSRSHVAQASLVVLSFLATVHSFIPATPTNRTDATDKLGNATVNVLWTQGDGTLRTDLARVVAAEGDGIAEGALVHFTDSAAKTATKTPWIALVACDANSTDASQDDIFVQAKNAGAVAGLLYSVFSETCAITPGYNNEDLDIYVSTSAARSRLLESTFRNIDAARYGSFDPETLDSEFTSITTYHNSDPPADPGYLLAILVANQPIFTSIYTELPSNTASSPDASATSSGEASTNGNDASSAAGTDSNGAVPSARPSSAFAILFSCLILLGA